MDKLISNALRALGGEQANVQRRPQEFALEERPRTRRRQQSEEQAERGAAPDGEHPRRARVLPGTNEIAKGSLTENEIERDAIPEERQQRRGIRRDAIPKRSALTESLRRDLRNQSMVRRAILLSEILDRPRAFRQYGRE